MKYYELNICGMDIYSPRWFVSKKGNKADFKKTVKKIIKEILPKIFSEGNKACINGYYLMEKILPLMEKNGFREIGPEQTVSLLDCWLDGQEKPAILTDKQWKEIIKHNNKSLNISLGEK